MSDGCTIDMKGLDNVLKSLKEFTPKLKAALTLDAKNIAANMEKWSKENANWNDQTTHARAFLKSTVKWTNANTLMVAMSHNVEYGVYLELCNEGKYAILEKAIQEFTPQFISGWKEIAKAVGVI